MQKGDPHRRALLDVAAQASALAQQFVTSMAQQVADEVGAGDERGLDTTTFLRDQRQGRDPFDVSLADYSLHPVEPLLRLTNVLVTGALTRLIQAVWRIYDREDVRKGSQDL